MRCEYGKEIKLEVDLKKFRYSLVGDGYLLEEVKNGDCLTEQDKMTILGGGIL